MKLLPSPPRTTRTSDAVGHGTDIALTVAVMFGVGYGLDRWLGTAPVFMIVMTVLAGIGFFAKFKYQYDARMDQLEAERAERVRTGAERSAIGSARD
jgi:F0F1-type ATP synthase assembly protein I